MFERDDDLMVDHMSRDCTKLYKTVQMYCHMYKCKVSNVNAGRVPIQLTIIIFILRTDMDYIMLMNQLKNGCVDNQNANQGHAKLHLIITQLNCIIIYTELSLCICIEIYSSKKIKLENCQTLSLN